MNEELRDAIGKSLYKASTPLMDDDEPTWDELPNKEEWILRAEKVVSAFLLYVREDYGKEHEVATNANPEMDRS